MNNTKRPAWWPTAEQKRHADAGCAHPDQCNVPTDGHELGPCMWYALCELDAEGYVEHPILGLVPTCDRCRTKHDMVFVDQWQALADVAGTPDEPSPVMQTALKALEEVGFLTHILADGTAVADAAEPADRDGQTLLHGSLRITQEA